MESLAIMTSSVSSSMTSPRWPSARLASLRAPVRDQREMSSRAQGTSSVVTAASAHQFSTAPLPPAFKGPSVRQSSATIASTSEQTAFWSMQSNLRSLIHTWRNDLSLEAFIRDPNAWLMTLVYRLQSVLSRLFTDPARNSTGHPGAAASSAQKRSSVATEPVCEPATRRCSSGRYVPSASGRQVNEAALTSTRLVATQQVSPAPSGQRPIVPIAALALATAAAVAFGGTWVLRRWRAMTETQREQVQRTAVKKDNLARQKQRFQRALVVDSVNLELPPIKDMDVQPGPVQVEKIISQNPSHQRDLASASSSQRSGAMPGPAGESLRQWQQFMSASRATEVTNMSGNKRGVRNAAEQASDRPYVALDDRMLADLSERIRRANDLTAAGESPPPMPVITFEQLYANNHETDDEAMARRAAERKARWQKEHPAAPASTAAPHNSATARPPPAPPKKPAATATAPASKARPKASISDNPFAVGILANSASALATGSGSPSVANRSSSPAVATSSSSPANAPAASRNSKARNGVRSHEPSMSQAVSRSETAVSAGSSTRNPFLEPPAATTTARADSPEVSSSGGGVNSPPPIPNSGRTDNEQGSRNTENKAEPATSTLTPTLIVDVPGCSAAVDNLDILAPDATSQLRIPVSSATESSRQTSTPSLSKEADGRTSQREQDDLMASPGRVKRQPATGKLRKPETHSPGLARLMRRPSGTSATLEEPKSPRAVVPDLQLSESTP